LDNIDPHSINRVIDLVTREKDHTLLVVISKSGETPETISQFMLFNDLLRDSPGIKERIVLITAKEGGILREVADKENYSTLNVPDGIGGRFSVLTPVGLFPALFMGLDIEGILAGAHDMAYHIKETFHGSNMALALASTLYLLERRGKDVHVMMPYCERLSAFADWFRQLEAESLGKGGYGATPVKALGVTDQHSQLQLYVDGPKDKIVLFLYAEGEKRLIPDSFPYLGGLDYLRGKDLGDLFRAELAGTKFSLLESNVPNLTLVLDQMNSYNLGALFFLFEMVITFLGYLYGVNPFDQPGVELGKIYTKAIMGKRGLDSEREKAAAYLSSPGAVIVF
jgi:glucose-6-phosphate isomerase